MINKSISLSAQVNSLSNEAKILFTWAIPHFDDEGRMRGESQFVKASVVPLSNWSMKRVDKLIEEICKAGLWERNGNSRHKIATALEERNGKSGRRG